MKHLKILGLAAAAALAVMAFGTGSASAATKLCSTEAGTPGGCPAGKFEYKGHIEAKVTNPPGVVLVTNLTTVTCEESNMTLHANTPTNVAPTTSITGEVTNLTFAKCTTSAKQNCTVTVVNLPYPAHVQGTIDGFTSTSSLTVTDEKGAGATVVCGFVINCTLTTKEATLHGVNSTTPTTTEFTATKVPLERHGGICPATAEWNASYQVTTPAGFTVH